MDRTAKVLLGVIGFLFGLCLLPIGAVQMLSEGPHGPHGEITSDPSSSTRMFLICGFGLLLMLASLLLAVSPTSGRPGPKE